MALEGLLIDVLYVLFWHSLSKLWPNILVRNESSFCKAFAGRHSGLAKSRDKSERTAAEWLLFDWS